MWRRTRRKLDFREILQYGATQHLFISISILFRFSFTKRYFSNKKPPVKGGFLQNFKDLVNRQTLKSVQGELEFHM